ncbi:hypothetical protein EIN_418100 [Entamoeba invadens IP1]|uniref:Uncharacterized protein n=1 Tax=Entamoeba invadens IP1 TaxID=370355 RepID=A0A0A1U1R8_ENTIV|nr:hypothetical protein EIN_418100 [Entamoeba invadens IP1]ELP87961.1 hypothetical protein EIN_418100 [Entamoeba invadens IP1]|eukprot:XP_004254732.1 hypothetical protein EIN_418100 [Entamoeba invadens IP1]
METCISGYVSKNTYQVQTESTIIMSSNSTSPNSSLVSSSFLKTATKPTLKRTRRTRNNKGKKTERALQAKYEGLWDVDEVKGTLLKYEEEVAKDCAEAHPIPCAVFYGNDKDDVTDDSITEEQSNEFGSVLQHVSDEDKEVMCSLCELLKEVHPIMSDKKIRTESGRILNNIRTYGTCVMMWKKNICDEMNVSSVECVVKRIVDTHRDNKTINDGLFVDHMRMCYTKIMCGEVWCSSAFVEEERNSGFLVFDMEIIRVIAKEGICSIERVVESVNVLYLVMSFGITTKSGAISVLQQRVSFLKKAVYYGVF